MALHLGIFLIWAGAFVFLQLDHVDGDTKTSGNCTVLEVKPDISQCTFPFIYCGQTFDNCTTSGSLLGTRWCSVTPNYDDDKGWKYC
uniref:Fibronectin type-II domain-containing protein n=1 Tax=Equus asinus TaxID=9793 RepID=A0A8C4PNZ7_EQUAS